MQQAETLDELQMRIVGLRDYFDVEHVVYHSVNATGGQYAAQTYTDDWKTRYFEQQYDRLDPVVLGAYQRFHPVDWKTLDWSGKNAQSFLSEALVSGVGSQGLSVPLRGPSGHFALFTVNTNEKDDKWAGFVAEKNHEIVLAAHFINQTALALEAETAPRVTTALSPREKDSLTMLALGLNRAMAADKLSISEHTLRVYIESARHKLGAVNTTQAVARAISSGLIII